MRNSKQVSFRVFAPIPKPWKPPNSKTTRTAWPFARKTAKYCKESKFRTLAKDPQFPYCSALLAKVQGFEEPAIRFNFCEDSRVLKASKQPEAFFFCLSGTAESAKKPATEIIYGCTTKKALKAWAKIAAKSGTKSKTTTKTQTHQKGEAAE